MNKFFTYSKVDIFKKFNTSINGLSDEVAKQNEKYGINALPQSKGKNFISRLLFQFKDWMIIVLLVSALISLGISIFEGNGDYFDAIIIFAIVVFNAILGVVQEMKAENAMAELKKMAGNTTTVVRNGKVQKIENDKVVVGDKILFEAGDIICADLYIVEAVNLKINESMLTGESKPVSKMAVENLATNTALGDRKNIAHSGSVVLNGRGVGIVVAVGQDTEIGKIAQMINNSKDEPTLLQKNLSNLGKVITVAVLVIASIIFFLDVAISGKNLLDSFMTAIAIAVSAIPESLPAVVTIIMALGVVKMGKKNAIVKRLHSVETLGACEIICTDKTGTLTQNKMQVRKVFLGREFCDFSSEFNVWQKRLLNCMVLNNDAKFSAHSVALGDPTETALLDFANDFSIDKNKLEQSIPRISEIPFSSDTKLMWTLHKTSPTNIMYIKGAPDRLLKKSSKIQMGDDVVSLNNAVKLDIENAIKQMGDDALRVLAFGYKNTDKDFIDESEGDFIFLGLVGLADPARPQAKTAVKTCIDAGMQPIMITGDHASTAFAIARELGIATKPNQVMLGSEIDQLNDEEFSKKIKDIKVFARVSPQNKVRIVKAWKHLGKIVAMTGDGVNDAPSLKTAHIGIGMGISGTDVTKQVADIVLADDNFSTIIYAVKEGRKIFDNIQKTIQFLFSTNITEVVALVLATVFFPQSVFLLPIQILFINLITDSLPAIALGLENSENNIMKRKPRKIDDSIFSGGVGKKIIYQSILQVVIVMSVFIFAYTNFDVQVANTMAFLTINIVQLFHMFNVRTHQSIFKSNPFKNRLLILSFVAGIGLTLLVALTPLAAAFKLATLSLSQWGIIFGASLLIIPIVEMGKFLDNHITRE